MDTRSKQRFRRFVGEKLEEFHVRLVESDLLREQPQYRKNRHGLVCEANRNIGLNLNRCAGVIAIQAYNMAFATHDLLKTSLTQGAQQIIILHVDSEGPINLKRGGPTLHFEKTNLLRAEKVGHDLAQTLDGVFPAAALAQPFACRFQPWIVHPSSRGLRPRCGVLITV